MRIYHFDAILVTFKYKSNTLLSKLNTFQIEVDILQIKRSAFQNKLESLREDRMIFVQRIFSDFLWNVQISPPQ